MYGGGFATIPAYLKDLFGGYNVSAIHGRLLTAWSTAGIVGPLIVNGILDHYKAAGLNRMDGYPRGPAHHGRSAGRRLHRQPDDSSRRRPLLAQGHTRHHAHGRGPLTGARHGRCQTVLDSTHRPRLDHRRRTAWLGRLQVRAQRSEALPAPTCRDCARRAEIAQRRCPARSRVTRWPQRSLAAREAGLRCPAAQSRASSSRATADHRTSSG